MGDDTMSRRIAEAVLEHARADPDDPAARLLAIHARLADVLAPIVGEHGFEGMFAASIRTTRLAHPELAPFATSDKDSPHDAFWAALRAIDAEQVERVERASLSTFFELLTDFIGDELTRRILHEAWPSLL